MTGRTAFFAPLTRTRPRSWTPPSISMLSMPSRPPLPAPRHDHTFNAAVVLNNLEQLPLLRLRHQVRHIARLSIPDLDDGDAMLCQVGCAFGKYTAIK